MTKEITDIENVAPDLEFSQDVGACDPKVAGKYRDGLRK
jgi:hypothetical protein